ncbi:unnamed protein product [Lampetra fluviatilis]
MDNVVQAWLQKSETWQRAPASSSPRWHKDGFADVVCVIRTRGDWSPMMLSFSAREREGEESEQMPAAMAAAAAAPREGSAEPIKI